MDKAKLWTNEGQLHFRFKILNNSTIPFPISHLAFPSCQVLLAQNLAKKIQPFKRLNLSGILADLPPKEIPASKTPRVSPLAFSFGESVAGNTPAPREVNF